MKLPGVRLRAMRVGSGMLLFAASGALGCSSGGGDDEAACDAYKNDPPPAASIAVRFRNDRAEPIFLGSQLGCGDIRPFALLDASDKALEWQGAGCGQLCEDLLAGVQTGCPDICLVPPVYLIEPGGHKDITWKGTVFQPLTVEASCRVATVSGDMCQREARPAAGTYTLIGEAFLTASGCAAGEACTCDASTEGWCQLESSAAVGSETVTAINSIVMPASVTEVELSFQ